MSAGRFGYCEGCGRFGDLARWVSAEMVGNAHHLVVIDHHLGGPDERGSATGRRSGVKVIKKECGRPAFF